MKKTPKEIEEKVILDYQTGKFSSREVGAKYNISKTTVLQILRNNGIEPVNNRLINQNLIENYFEKIDTEEKAYFLGFIFADGSVSESG